MKVRKAVIPVAGLGTRFLPATKTVPKELLPIVDIPSIANPDELAKRVTTIAEEENVLRVKGFVDVGGKPMRLLLQAVGPRVNHYYDRAWTAEDDRRSRLVVIGLKGLNRPAIERILAG